MIEALDGVFSCAFDGSLARQPIALDRTAAGIAAAYDEDKAGTIVTVATAGGQIVKARAEAQKGGFVPLPPQIDPHAAQYDSRNTCQPSAMME